MKLLLDTHIVLWMLSEPERLGSTVREMIEDSDNELIVSIASILEIAIKTSIGKLAVDDLWLEGLIALDTRFMPIEMNHAWRVGQLPLIHRDPFDRLLVAQAQCENAALVTADEMLCRYGGLVLLSEV